MAQQGSVRGVHVHPGLPESLVHVAAGARHQFEGVLVRGVGEAFQGVDCQVAVLGQDFQVLAAGAPADLPGFGPACPEAAGAVPGVAAAWRGGKVSQAPTKQSRVQSRATRPKIQVPTVPTAREWCWR